MNIRLPDRHSIKNRYRNGSARAGPLLFLGMRELLDIEARHGPPWSENPDRQCSKKRKTKNQKVNMMKKEKGLKGLKIKGSVLLMLAASGALVPQLAFATSAGTVLRNSVTVSYADNALNTYSVDAEVDVTVDLVGSVLWGNAPVGQTVGQGDQLSPAYEIYLTNTGNGADTYTLADTTTESCQAPADDADLSGQTFTLSSTVKLGATVSSGVATNDTVPTPDHTTIPVSNLVSGIDGFANGDIVMINNLPYTVVSATDNASPLTDTLVIEDEGGIAAAFITGAGIQIGERTTITYGGNGTAGTLADPSYDCQHNHTLTATGTQPNDNAAAFDDVTGWATVVEALDVTVTKYVRNADDNDKNPTSGGVQYNGTGDYYFVSGVTGNPDDTLEYLVVIDNTSDADAVNVVFEDTLPAFTSYVAESLAVDTDGDGSFDQDTLTDETEADDELNGIITQSGQQINVYPGLDGAEDGNVGGTVAGGSKTAVRYSVTID